MVQRYKKYALHSHTIHYLSVKQVDGAGSVTGIMLRVSYHYHSCTSLVQLGEIRIRCVILIKRERVKINVYLF